MLTRAAPSRSAAPQGATAAGARHSAFISYSRRDRDFASRLETALERYVAPRDLGVPARRLDIFRDEEDLTGVEYHRSVEEHLHCSAKLIVVCSPHARASTYVDDEIRRFLAVRGAEHVIPLLLAGIPNNEARGGDDRDLAFPLALCEALQVPLAADFRNIDLARERPDRGRFVGAWHMLLANLFDVSRGELEQRERRRRARTLRAWTAFAITIITVLSAALVVTLVSRRDAIAQRGVADTRRREAETERDRASRAAEAERRARAEEARQRQAADQQRQRAEEQRAEAVRQEKMSRSRELATASLMQLAADPELSVFLAAAAARVSPTAESVDALRQALRDSHLRATLSGHRGAVSDATFSRDGTLIATAGQDGTARIWDARTGRSLATLTGHRGAISSVDFSPDGRLVATASDDDTARVWDTSTGRTLAELRGHGRSDEGVVTVRFSPDGRSVLTASADRTAASWNPDSGHVSMVFRGHTKEVWSAEFSPDGHRILTASADATARVWDASSGQVIQVLGGHAADLSVARFSPDGRHIVTADWQGHARLWSADTFAARDLAPHDGRVNDARFSPDSRLVVTVGTDRSAHVSDTASGALVADLRGHTGDINAAAFSPDGRLVATASADRTVRVWVARDGRLVRDLRGHRENVTVARFSPDGKSLLTGAEDGSARLWEPRQAPEIELPHPARVTMATFDPEGRRLITGCANVVRIWDGANRTVVATLMHVGGAYNDVHTVSFSPDAARLVTSTFHDVKLWSARDGRPIADLYNGSDSIRHVAWSADGRMLAGVGDDHMVHLWDGWTGRPVRAFKAYDSILTRVAFSPIHPWIVTTAGFFAKVWDAGTAALVSTSAVHRLGVVDVAFSPDGRVLASVSAGGTARIWDPATGRTIRELPASGDYGSVAFSRDGHLLLSRGGLTSVTASVWSLATGQAVVLRGHTASLTDAQFSPDGRFAVTASRDGTARVWSVDSGAVLMVLTGHPSPEGAKAPAMTGFDPKRLGPSGTTGAVLSASFSPDGMSVVTTGVDGTAQVYRCDVCGTLSQLLDLAGRRVTRQLNADERRRYLHEPQR